MEMAILIVSAIAEGESHVVRCLEGGSLHDVTFSCRMHFLVAPWTVLLWIRRMQPMELQMM